VFTFVAVDGGMGDNLDLALFGQRFEAGIVGQFDRPGSETVTVVGRHYESGDVLAEGCPFPPPRSATCSPYPRPAPTHSRWPTTTAATPASRWRSPRDGRGRLVVRRERWDDLMAGDVN
jgi:diaminopimelate decarboxylase